MKCKYGGVGVWTACLLCFLLEGQVPLAQDLSSDQVTVQFDYRDADIRKIIEWVATLTKKEFRVDPEVNGNIYMSVAEPVGMNTVFEVFVSTLATYGFDVVPADDAIYVVPTGKSPGKDTLRIHPRRPGCN